jgi:hypothetical protein
MTKPGRDVNSVDEIVVDGDPAVLDAGDGWLRTKFTELGIIQFENGTDTSEEYGDLDAVAADRAPAARARA